jgi:hypothetical protein
MLGLWLSATCGVGCSSPATSGCFEDVDCAAGFACVNGSCAATGDGGARRDGGAASNGCAPQGPAESQILVSTPQFEEPTCGVNSVGKPCYCQPSWQCAAGQAPGEGDFTCSSYCLPATAVPCGEITRGGSSRYSWCKQGETCVYGGTTWGCCPAGATCGSVCP